MLLLLWVFLHNAAKQVKHVICWRRAKEEQLKSRPLHSRLGALLAAFRESTQKQPQWYFKWGAALHRQLKTHWDARKMCQVKPSQAKPAHVLTGHVWCKKNTTHHQNNTTVKHDSSSIKFWDRFPSAGTGASVSVKGIMKSSKYLTVLAKKNLKALSKTFKMTRETEGIFQYDNTLKHASKSPKEWLHQNKSRVRGWPTVHLWGNWKRALWRRCPANLSDLKELQLSTRGVSCSATRLFYMFLFFILRWLLLFLTFTYRL